MGGIEFRVFGSDASWVRAVAEVQELCRAQGYAENRVREILTALEEALSNACEHAHGGEASISIGVKARTDGASLWIEVRDRGAGLAEVPPPPDLSLKLTGADRPSGWGLFLMRSLASVVEFDTRSPGGCCVRLRFDSEAPPTPAEIRILEV